MAAAYLYYIYGLGVPLLYIAIALFWAESVVIKPYIIYKAIYNNIFLANSYIVEFSISTYLGLYPSFLVVFPF